VSSSESAEKRCRGKKKSSREQQGRAETDQVKFEYEWIGMDWEDEMWTGDLRTQEGRWESCRTGAEPNHEIIEGRSLKYQENGPRQFI
jgi:hypothetical protein